MTTQNMRLAITLAVGFVPTLVWAQHDAYQAGAVEASSTELTQCFRVQPVIENVINAAMVRAEAGRLSNSPTELRAALDHLEAALRDVRAQTAPCAAAAAASDLHAGHTMPGVPAPSSPPPTQAPAGAADPHAGHMAPSTQSPASTTAPAQAPAAAANPHAGHGAASSVAVQMDPVNGLTVDPATAPKTTYQGQTYYFSSEQSKTEFLKNPARFAKKPKK